MAEGKHSITFSFIFLSSLSLHLWNGGGLIVGISFSSKWLWFFSQLVPPFSTISSISDFSFSCAQAQETPSCLTPPLPRPCPRKDRGSIMRPGRCDWTQTSSLPPPPCLLASIYSFTRHFQPPLLCVDRLSYLKSYSCSCLFTGSGWVGEIVLDQESQGRMLGNCWVLKTLAHKQGGVFASYLKLLGTVAHDWSI